jgi:hypothetical protein
VKTPSGLVLGLALCLVPTLARAQRDQPVEHPADQVAPEAMPTTEPPKGSESGWSRYQSRVRGHRPSPEWTQDRMFTATRFWLLDPGTYEAQMWFRTRVPHENMGTRGPAEFLWQHEIEIGLFPHIQLDLYENLTFNVNETGSRGIQQEGVQIEARIAIPSYYGQIPTNPVIYVEFHPRHDAPDRAELRLLLGGAPTAWLYLAANPYVETNVEETIGKFVADAEVGTTLAAGFRVASWMTLTAQAKIGGDMLGDPENKFHFVWFLGPGFLAKPLPGNLKRYLKIMATCLFAMPGTDRAAQQFEPLLILGSQW